MLERLLGRKPKEVPQPEPVQLWEIELPPNFDRQYYLLYLLSATAAEGNFARDFWKIDLKNGYYHRSLTRGQIERLAVEIYADILLDRTRTLAEITLDSLKLPPSETKMLSTDPVLNKVSLSYTQREMEEFSSPFEMAKIGKIYEHPELLGPVRPLLLDLYELSGSSDFELRARGQDDFSGISLKAALLTTSMRTIFAYSSMQDHDVVLKVGEYSQELVWRNQPPSIPAIA